MQIGTITITLEGVTIEETERLRKMIHTMFTDGVFNIRNGKAILNFDNDGLAEIEKQIKTWKRGKEPVVMKRLEQFKIELTPVDKSSIVSRN